MSSLSLNFRVQNCFGTKLYTLCYIDLPWVEGRRGSWMDRAPRQNCCLKRTRHENRLLRFALIPPTVEAAEMQNNREKMSTFCGAHRWTRNSGCVRLLREYISLYIPMYRG